MESSEIISGCLIAKIEPIMMGSMTIFIQLTLTSQYDMAFKLTSRNLLYYSFKKIPFYEIVNQIVLFC